MQPAYAGTGGEGAHRARGSLTAHADGVTARHPRHKLPVPKLPLNCRFRVCCAGTGSARLRAWAVRCFGDVLVGPIGRLRFAALFPIQVLDYSVACFMLGSTGGQCVPLSMVEAWPWCGLAPRLAANRHCLDTSQHTMMWVSSSVCHHLLMHRGYAARGGAGVRVE
jgi:hypothetical protein